MAAKTVRFGSCIGALALAAAASAAFGSVFNMPAGLQSLQLVTVGDTGNPDLPLGYGGVAYDYRIGTYEVTNAQYAEFLNAVEPQNVKGLYTPAMGTDPRGGILRSGSPPTGAGMATPENRYTYAPKSGWENKPVTFVTKIQAAQFVNWLHNGQPVVAPANGWIESRSATITFGGAYTLTAWNAMLNTRLEGATFFLPSEDEWAKAAFYQPAAAGGDTDGYWNYATRSNAVPTIAIANAVGDITNGGPNVVNYANGADWGYDANSVLLNGNVTTVGTAGTSSYYGTFDQNGNLWEFTEGMSGTNVVAWGGTWDGNSLMMTSAQPSVRQTSIWANNTSNASGGFRVAALVPEPSSLGLLALGSMLLTRHLRRRA